jgi:DNA-binding MarR family transcriptional regulator
MASRTSAPRADAVADALHSAAIHLLRRVRKEDEKTGVPAARLSALSVLVFGGPQRLTDLARIEQVKAPTMTKIVAGLEGDGLARRRVDPADARVVRLEPTARGKRVLHEGRRRRVAKLAGVLDELPAEELETLDRASAILTRVLGRM